MNDKKVSPKKPLPNTKRKPPVSLFLWLLAFLLLASLIIFRSSPYFAAEEEWSANAFLAQLEKGAVVSAEIMPESDKILAISGLESRRQVRSFLTTLTAAHASPWSTPSCFCALSLLLIQP